MLKNLIIFIGISLLSLLPNQIKASHLAGGEITYKCLGGNKYEFFLNLYIDCSGQAPLIPQPLIFKNSCGLGNDTIFAKQRSKQDITQICPGQKSNCSGGFIPGINLYVFSDTITLPPCDSWTVYYEKNGGGGSNRNSSLNLISNASVLNDFYILTTLNSFTAPCHNSPTFTTSPIGYSCINQSYTYNYGVVSSADSVHYSFTSALTTGAVPCIYAPSYSATNPISGITLDPNSGTIKFNTNLGGTYVVVILLKEYDANGHLIGTMMHDMEFVVEFCGNKLPDATSGKLPNSIGNAKKTGDYSLEICAGNSFSFSTVYTDPDLTDTLVFVGSTIKTALPNGATAASINNTGNKNPLTLNMAYTAPATITSDGNFSFTVTVRDNHCPIVGKQVYTYNVKIVPNDPTPSLIVPVGKYCLNSNNDTLQVSNPKASGRWSGPGITDNIRGIFSPSIAKQGSHQITYSSGNSCATKQTDVITIEVINPLNATIKPVPVQCIAGSPYQLQAATSGGTWSGIGVDVNGLFDPVIAGKGAHPIKYFINTPCYVEDIEVINVVDKFDSTITSKSPYCSKVTSDTLKAVTPGGLWQGVGIKDVNLGIFSPSTAGIGTWPISYTTFGYCGSTDTIDITVKGTPAVSFTADPKDGCEPTIIKFTSTTRPTDGTYLWSFGDGGTSRANDPSYTYQRAGGPFDVSLTYTDINGCSKDTIQRGLINIYSQPIASFEASPQPTNTGNTLIHFTDKSSGGIDSWAWKFSTLGTSNDKNPSFLFPDDSARTYPVQLVVSNIHECADTSNYFVKIDPLTVFYAPNSFTPNDNGLNETFGGKGKGINLNTFEMLIFNRWGEIIFQSNNLFEGWNGKYKNTGADAPEDVYVWKVNFKDFYGKKYDYMGSVTIVR